MGREFRVELRGGAAHLGQVPARDVAKLLLGVERALARQSAHAISRPAAATGRWEAVVARAVQVRLAAIEEGSVVPVLELPELTTPGWGWQAETLGETALGQIIDVIAGERPAERDVAQAFVALTRDLDIGRRYDSVLFNHSSVSGRRIAVLDGAARDRFRANIDLPPVEQASALRGTLVEADFERMSARLRTPIGEAVLVAFAPDLSDSISDALRRPAEFQGEITYDPVTSAATAIRLREVLQEPSIWGDFDSDEFWTRQSLHQLEMSGLARPVLSAAELQVGAPADSEDLEAFFAALAHEAL